MGRVELLVNGMWGTICNDAWNYPDAQTACRSVDRRVNSIVLVVMLSGNAAWCRSAFNVANLLINVQFVCLPIANYVS